MAGVYALSSVLFKPTVLMIMELHLESPISNKLSKYGLIVCTLSNECMDNSQWLLHVIYMRFYAKFCNSAVIGI